MTDKTPVKNTKISPDWFVRGALAKAGDAFDRLLGRNWAPSSTLATSEIIERIKKLLDAEAREVAGKGLVVPHDIKLKIQWDKFSTESEDLTKNLETELLAATVDHINDSLYYTFAPVSVAVEQDYFIEGVQLKASFGGHAEDATEAERDVTITGINLGQLTSQAAVPAGKPNAAEFMVRFSVGGNPREKRLRIGAGQSISVGRAASNGLVIDDKSVSKIHASISSGANDDLLLADTGSTNGTFLNGERIAYGKAIKITESDKISFGDVEISLERVHQDTIANTEETDASQTVEIGGFEFTSRTNNEPEPIPVDGGTDSREDEAG